MKIYINASLGDGTFYEINEHLIVDYGLRDLSITEEHLKLVDELITIELSERVENLQNLKKLLETNNKIIVVDKFSRFRNYEIEPITNRCLVYSRENLNKGLNLIKEWKF